MSIHINAEPGSIAETVLLPGDLKRAEWIARTFLKKGVVYSTVRGMTGTTGWTSDGRRVSVHPSGMGMPSLSIYVNELIKYGVKKIIRVGSCGAMTEKIALRNIIVATGASSDSAMSNRRFDGMNFAPTADFRLLQRAAEVAEKFKIPAHFGAILSTDKFYDDAPKELAAWEIFADYNVLAIEMETAELYTLAARANIQALTILTVSDNLLTGEKLSPGDRETSFHEMVELALEI